MKERIMKFKDTTKSYWGERNRTQKGIFIGSVVFIFALIIVISLFVTNTNYVPLYNNLSLQEAGQIQTELDARGVNYELTNGGTTITVPEEQVDNLLVDLAAQGIPNSGEIDYSFFSENSSWGVTDNEFNMMKLDAMQTELANLIKGIEGIQQAEVMINIPDKPIFVSETTQPTTASIVIHTQPGHRFEGNQIESLYHLVSKAVPNLSPENIIIRNQYLEYFDRDSHTAGSQQDTYSYQQNVKKEIERDIQQRVQHMLGTMVGMDNVVVSVTTDVDFTSENRIEELVEPIDPDNMEGLPVSIESIHETYTGSGAQAGGDAGTGEGEIPNYPGNDASDDGEYELVKETINNEFNRIYKEIVESPYKVRDIGVQVAVDSKDDQGNDVNQQEVEENITNILSSIINTSVDKEFAEPVTGENMGDNISVAFQEFKETTSVSQGEENPSVPTWLYFVGAGLLVLVILLIVLLLRKRKPVEETVETTTMSTVQNEEDIPELNPQGEESESVVRKKQLEKMAKEKPEEFAKLLRSWIGDE